MRGCPQGQQDKELLAKRRAVANKERTEKVWDKNVLKRFRMRVHTDWIKQVQYLPDLDPAGLVSCSLDGTVQFSSLDRKKCFAEKAFRTHTKGTVSSMQRFH